MDSCLSQPALGTGLIPDWPTEHCPPWASNHTPLQSSSCWSVFCVRAPSIESFFYGKCSAFI